MKINVNVLLKALGDPARLDICRRLAFEELTVAHLTAELGMSQPLISHHLRVLKKAGVVVARRTSYWTYYRLVPDALEELAGEFVTLLAAAETARPAPPAESTYRTVGPPRWRLGMSTWDQELARDEVIRHSIDRLAAEFVGIFSRPTVERYVMDSAAHFEGSRVRQFIPLFTQRFARERLRALAQAEGSMDKGVPEVLFVCVHNAGRSQMAAALLHHIAEGKVNVRSAGSAPVWEINEQVRRAMDEAGLDIGQEFPKPLTDEFVRAADVVITMGCGDACPIYPGKRYEDWELPDPAGRSLEDVRAIREEIRERVARLLSELVPV